MNEYRKSGSNLLLILKEYFGIHDYPFELINVIVGLYGQASNFEMFVNNNVESLLLTPSGQVYRWLPINNALGGCTMQKMELSVRKIVHKKHHTFFITTNNELYALGYNGNGILGLNIDNHTLIIKEPIKVELSDVKDIISGEDHVIAITASGDVYSWGDNVYDQLGRNDGWNDKPGRVEISNIKQVYCGFQYTIAVTKDNKLYSWGSRGQGRLGRSVFGNTPQRISFFDNIEISDVFVSSDHTIVLTSNKEVYVWGSNNNNRFNLSHEDNVYLPQKIDLSQIKDCDLYDSKILQIINPNVKETILGYKHKTILTNQDELYSCGINNYGQLGLGNYKDSETYQKIQIPTVRKFIRKHDCSFAITYTNELYVWGNVGPLGLGYADKECTPQKLQIQNVKDIFGNAGYLTMVVTWFGEIYYFGTWFRRKTNSIQKLF